MDVSIIIGSVHEFKKLAFEPYRSESADELTQNTRNPSDAMSTCHSQTTASAVIAGDKPSAITDSSEDPALLARLRIF